MVLPEGTVVEPHSLIKIYVGVGTGEDHTVALNSDQEIMDDSSGSISFFDSEGVGYLGVSWAVDFVE